MPPRKKIVVKTVRKVKPSMLSTPTSASVADAEPNPTRSQLNLSPSTELIVCNKPTIENAVLLEPEPVIEPEPKPSPKPEAATEKTVMNVPESSKTATGEALEDAKVIPPETTPIEQPAKSGTKTVIRVKKVVRKKIVKKLVPKGSVAVKKVEAEPLQDGNLSLMPCIDKSVNLSSALDSSVQLDKTKKSFDSNASQQQKPENTVGEVDIDDAVKLDSSKSEDSAEVKKEYGHSEEKADILESKKEDDGLDAAVVKEQEAAAVKEQEVSGFSDRMKKRKAEIFVGGLDRDTKEEDLRNVFGKVGEILEVRIMMDGQTGKNKGYAFLRYVEPSQAKRAVSEFAKVEVCGKICGAAAVQGNDTIFLGNIDKKWKREDLMKLLTKLEIENIDAVTVMMDPRNMDSNRGFAFLELETNRDAQRAYKKLQKKDVFGKGRNIKVAWADSFNVPDEEEMQKVKSVYAEGVPDSWDEAKLKETFKKFGEIDRIVLGKNIKSSKRSDIAFINYKTREAALLCIDSFNCEDLSDNGSKVNIKVALAKRVQKANQNKGGQKSTISYSLNDKHKPDKRVVSLDYSPAVIGSKRTFSSLGDDILYSDLRGYPRTRLDSSFGVPHSSYPMMSHGLAGSSLSHYPHQPLSTGYSTDFLGSLYQSGSRADAYQARQGVPPYTSSIYDRYRM